MRETISPRLAFVAAFAPVLHERVELVHVHAIDDVEGAVVGFVGGAFENHPGEVFIVKAVSLGAAAVSYGDDGVNGRQGDVVAVGSGVGEPLLGGFWCFSWRFSLQPLETIPPNRIRVLHVGFRSLLPCWKETTASHAPYTIPALARKKPIAIVTAK